MTTMSAVPATVIFKWTYTKWPTTITISIRAHSNTTTIISIFGTLVPLSIVILVNVNRGCLFGSSKSGRVADWVRCFNSVQCWRHSLVSPIAKPSNCIIIISQHLNAQLTNATSNFSKWHSIVAAHRCQSERAMWESERERKNEKEWECSDRYLYHH